MTEEQIAKKKLFAGEKKTSMKRRDDHHDYTERRMYMITLEVEGRHPVFGRIVGDAFAERGSNDEPRMELTEIGKAVQSEWMGIHNYYPQIEVMAVQMMPDHMHGILFVTAPLPVHLGQVISGFKAGCRKAMRTIAAAKPHPTENPTTVAPTSGPTTAAPISGPTTAATTSTPTTVAPTSGPTTATTTNGPTTAATTSGNGTAKNTGDSLQVTALPSQSSDSSHQLFAKGYNDLILRSYDELPVWQNYLRDNPRRLLIKRATPDYLRPFFNLHIGTHSYSGIGNRHLLSAPRRIPVRLSRRLTEKDIERELQQLLDAAKQGAVLVSPAISPGEKRVMRAAFNAGFPTIVLMENGFTPMSKPHGEQFYACARGTLLMLSPWEHHNEKKKLTAEQCCQLNLMALELCESNV